MTDLQLDTRIKNLAKSKGVSIRQLCIKIEMTESGFSIALKNNTLKIETLAKIADSLDVPVGYFFGNEQTKVDNEEAERLKNRIKELELQLNDKQKIITLLENENKSFSNLVNGTMQKDLVATMLAYPSEEHKEFIQKLSAGSQEKLMLWEYFIKLQNSKDKK